MGMANPQKENGSFQIANEIAEALCKVNLSPYESRVLWFIFRKTYGWHRKNDHIPLTQFVKDIGLDRRLIHRALKSLSSKKMTVISRDDRNRLIVGFQKDYEQWILPHRKKPTVISRDDKLSSVEMTNCHLPRYPQKIIKIKDRVKDKPSPISSLPIVEKTIRRLNELAAKSYRSDSKTAVKLISARLRGGASEADCLTVVEDRCRRWGEDPKMKEYLRPSTLFSETNFENYLVEAQAANGNGHKLMVKQLGDGWWEVEGIRMETNTFKRRYRTEPRPTA
jgi:phage replication O-like protein O